MGIEPLSPLAEGPRYRRIAAFGDPGAAKTSWFRSALEQVGPQRVWVIACGTGISVLEDAIHESRIIRLASKTDVEVLEQDMLLALIARNYVRAYEFIRRNLAGVDWLLVDDWTRVCKGLETYGRLLMEQGKAYQIDRGENKPPANDTQALYGHLANAQLREAEKTIQLPVNLYMTLTGDIEYETRLVIEEYQKGGVTKRVEKNQRTGAKYAAPAIAGRAFLNDFMAIMDAVLYFHTKEERDAKNQSIINTRHLVRCRGNAEVKAKLRLPASSSLPDVFSIGHRTKEGTVRIEESDVTLARLHAQMLGTKIAK